MGKKERISKRSPEELPDNQEVEYGSRWIKMATQGTISRVQWAYEWNQVGCALTFIIKLCSVVWRVFFIIIISLFDFKRVLFVKVFLHSYFIVEEAHEKYLTNQ